MTGISVASSLLGEIQPNSLLEEIVETQIDQATEKKDNAPAENPLNGLAVIVQDTWVTNRDYRRVHEYRWLNAWRQYRGEFTSEELERIALAKEKNKFAASPFIKITKTKVLAAYGQIMEVLTGDNKFPLEVTAPVKPSGVADTVSIDIQGKEKTPDMSGQDVYGWAGDGKEIAPGTTTASLIRNTYDKLKTFLDGKKVNEGPALDRTKQIELHPAEDEAKEMNRVIQDQLDESNAELELRKCVFEACVLGTGVVKAPFTETIELPNWEKDPDTGFNVYTPKKKLVPKMKQVSSWDVYPEAGARTREDMNNLVEVLLLTANQLKKLPKSSKLFDPEAIKRALKKGSAYQKEDWEYQIVDRNVEINDDRYRVLNYWGYLDYETAIMYNLVKCDKDKKDADTDYELDSILTNIWVCNGEVVRATLSPFDTQEIPYYFVPYEEHPYQIWGIGVPENMSDAQVLINGHTRLSIDNLALAGSCVFEVSENQLTPGQDMSIYPGKVFKKQGGAPGQSIFAIKFNNTAPEHYAAIDRAKQYADDTTLPSYTHGSTGGIPGSTRTSSGISMMMGAAALGIKTVVNNFDHYLLSPVGEAFFRWNMQFNTDVTIKGNLEIVAKGTSQLLKREVKSQRLLSLIQTTQANPSMAPMLNMEYTLKELAKSMDLDPDKFINSPQNALIYAEIMRGLNVEGQGTNAGGVSGSGGPGANPQQAMAGANGSDPTGNGGGTIAPGASPMPGEAGYSQNPEDA